MLTRHLRGLLAALIAIGLASLALPSAHADPTPDPRGGQQSATPFGEAFYQPPSPLPKAAAGTILRSEKYTLALSVPGQGGQVPANATRIMYMSADTHSTPAAVTGTYLKATLPWKGPGPRPLVAVAVGTQGQGDQCAPSKTLAKLFQYTFPLDGWTNYEVITAYALLAQGMNVVMTDYYGLGTPAVHDYVNRAAEAHAVLDSIRAAEHLTGIRAPSLVFGYSQGGGAAAAAAELQGTYAPELDLRGTYAGAPPADLRQVFLNSKVINGVLPGIGGAAPGLVGYVLNGIRADYPETRTAIDRILNAEGRRMLGEVQDTCIAETAIRTMFRPLSFYTAGRKSARQLLLENPVLGRAIDEQRIGRRTPKAPVFVASGTNDDVIPYAQVRQLAVDWCRRGATVQMDTISWIPPLFPTLALGHFAPFVPAGLAAVTWVNERLSGRPAPNNCSTLTGSGRG